MTDPTNYDRPLPADFWASELFISIPDVFAWPLGNPPLLKEHVDSIHQRLFDIWHGLEDGIEAWPRPEQARRLKWMKRLELTMKAVMR